MATNIILTALLALTAISVSISLIRQTMRAARAEAALARIEAVINETGVALVEHVNEPVYRLGSAEPVGTVTKLAVY